jgi:hypothetical protein
MTETHTAHTRKILMDNIRNRAAQLSEFTDEQWQRVGTETLVEIDHNIEALHDALVRARIVTHHEFKTALALIHETGYDPETPQAEGMFVFLSLVWVAEADKSSTGWDTTDVRAEFARVYGGDAT